MPNNLISLQEAIKMTAHFRNKREEILDDQYKNKDILPRCESFDRTAFDTVLGQDGCVGLRIYLGMDDDDKISAIIVGVDENDKDILTNDNSDLIIDSGTRCPAICPPSSVLNPV